jgi:hypothetical protein
VKKQNPMLAGCRCLGHPYSEDSPGHAAPLSASSVLIGLVFVFVTLHSLLTDQLQSGQLLSAQQSLFGMNDTQTSYTPVQLKKRMFDMPAKLNAISQLFGMTMKV